MSEVVDQSVANEIVAQFAMGQAARNKSAIAQSVASRRMTPYTSCENIKAGQPVKSYIGGATGTISKNLAAVPDPTFVTKAAAAALAAFTAILGVFTKHHAQAVANEQSNLCGTVPELQAALENSDRLWAGGATRESLISDLQATSGAFKQATLTIFKECNASCFYQREFDAQIAVRAKVDYVRGAGSGALAFVKRNKLILGLTAGVAVISLFVAKTI